jgi:small subunit ribosomal protein S6
MTFQCCGPGVHAHATHDAERHKPVGRTLRKVARPAPKPRKYEMMIVVAPTVTEDGLPAVVERVSGMVEEQGGTIESVSHDSPWGHRRLAYPIQKFRDAFYVLFYFDCAPRGVAEIERELRLDAAVIRHLVVKFDPLSVRDSDGTGDEQDDGPVGADEADTDTAASAPPSQEGSSAPADDDADDASEDAADDPADVDADDPADGDEEETPDAVEASDEDDEAGDDEAGDGEDEIEDGEDNEA